jgi:hypothetical protein
MQYLRKDSVTALMKRAEASREAPQRLQERKDSMTALMKRAEASREAPQRLQERKDSVTALMKARFRLAFRV